MRLAEFFKKLDRLYYKLTPTWALGLVGVVLVGAMFAAEIYDPFGGPFELKAWFRQITGSRKSPSIQGPPLTSLPMHPAPIPPRFDFEERRLGKFTVAVLKDAETSQEFLIIAGKGQVLLLPKDNHSLPQVVSSTPHSPSP